MTMLADARCELAKALDLVLDHPNNLQFGAIDEVAAYAVRLGVESRQRRVYSIVTGRCGRSVSTQAFYDGTRAQVPQRAEAEGRGPASTATWPATTRRSRRSPRTS